MGGGDLNENIPNTKRIEHVNEKNVVHLSTPENESQASARLPLLHPKRFSPAWLPQFAPPDNFDLAIANIRASGFGKLTYREKQALEILLFDNPWKASSPHRENDERFRKIQNRYKQALPGIIPVLDSYGWPELDSLGANLTIDDPTGFSWILFAREDGFYFYFGEADEIYPVETSLEQLVTDLDNARQYKSLEEGGWREVSEDDAEE